MDELFVVDTENGRTCGMCGEIKPVTEFYKDGKDADGNTRYRRDCKNCYNIARMREKKAKEKNELRKVRRPAR